MVDQDRLSSTLCDFARTMLSDFSVERILDELVDRVADVLPVTGAGAVLMFPGKVAQYLAGSSQAALRFERLQTDLDEGPCRTVCESGQTVLVPDLAAEDRFPRFGPAASSTGVAAVFSVPLRYDGGCLGALDLYRDVPGDLDAPSVAVAQALADVAAAYLRNAQDRERALVTSDDFRDRSLHDPLTGLPNRTLLTERIEATAQRARRTHAAVAVLFIDLDHFKEVNDSFGHDVGDELLIAVAARLSALVRPSDTLARLSGDEFVFLYEGLGSTSDVDLLVTRVDEAFAAPFVLDGVDLDVTASVGIAYAGPGEAVTGQLVRDADSAMYQAKRHGGVHLTLPVAEVARERLDVERDLCGALSAAELDLAYQPIVRAADGFVTGAEALLRWTRPGGRRVPAATTVAVAGQAGLIAGIGAWVLQRSCRDRVTWLAEHPDHPLDLSVNVSPRQLMGRGFVATVARALAASGMDPAALVLEVTEGIFGEDGDRVLRVLEDLKAHGVRLALDNFGIGYCSLDYLRRFPVDIIKIDRSFVAGMGRDPAASAIVAAVTNLAHVLAMTVTAAGVETAAQRAAVAQVRCERAQGFLFARPMTAAALSASL